MSPPNITIVTGEQSFSRSDSYNSEEDHQHTDYPTEEDDDHYGEEDDLGPSDSASTSLDDATGWRNRSLPRAAGRRPHFARPLSQVYPVHSQAPSIPTSLDSSEDYRAYPSRGYQGPPDHAAYYTRGPAPGYPAGPGNPYMGYPRQGQVVPYGFNPNPFAPNPNAGGGHPYYANSDPRSYGADHYQTGYYGNFALPAHLAQFHITPQGPPEPPHTASNTPGPREELAALRAQEDRQREAEARIRKEAEESFQRRMDEMKKAQEETKREIERAKAEAERTTRERLESERRAEEERAKQHAEAMKRAEENARHKFEAEMKAAENARKKEEEERKRAEDAAKARLEAALKVQADEAARLKTIAEDAKLKAEADAAKKVAEEKAAETAKKEAEDKAKKAAEELKKQIEEDTKAKMAEEAKKMGNKPPIKFKDAVGRKFNFPFHLCSTWSGMEELIKQAFLQVDVLGPLVQQGHYDLIGPHNEIILPSVWDKVIQPDWQITMTMWPMNKRPQIGAGRGMPMPQMAGHRPVGAFPNLGQRHPGLGAGIPPPPGWNTTQPHILNADPRKSHSKERSSKRSSGLGGIFGHSSKSKSSSKKKSSKR